MKKIFYYQLIKNYIMKIIKLMIILCVIFTQYSGIKAQSHNLSVESFIGFPAQAYFNQSCSFYIFLSNNDSSDYQGAISILFYTDSLNSAVDSIGCSYTVYIPGNSFDTIWVGTFTFDSASFKLGGNVVVVWPVSSGGTQIMVTDTFYTYVEILGYAGISDIYLNTANNNIYPVPANEVLFLPQNIAENNIEYVRIIDMLGRQKYYSDKTVTSINTSAFEPGVYFIEIKVKDKMQVVLKFIISR